MSSNVLNLKHAKGKTFTRYLTLTDTSETPINITGFTFRSQVRQQYTDTAALFSFTFTITSGSAGEVTMSLPSTFYANQLGAPLVCVYDVEMVDGSGKVEELFRGTFTILPEATV